jgi:hypothetical protein
MQSRETHNDEIKSSRRGNNKAAMAQERLTASLCERLDLNEHNEIANSTENNTHKKLSN